MWISANTGLPAAGGINSIYADPSGLIYAGTYNDTYRSPDAGMTWSLFQAGAQKIIWDPTRSQTAYLHRTYAGVERTVNSFASRIGFNTGLSTDAFFENIAIAMNGSTVYAGYTWKGVYRLND